MLWSFYFTPKFLAECNNDPEEVKHRLYKMKIEKLIEHFLKNPDEAIKAYTDLISKSNIVENECTEVCNESNHAIEGSDILSSAD